MASPKASAFSRNAPSKPLQGWQELAFQHLERGDPDRRGDHVIGGLAHVDVVVGAHALLLIVQCPAELQVG